METTYYTLNEIKLNNNKQKKSLWIIIDESVYDVTNFLHDHPGGAALLEEWAGKDATRAFEEVGHSSAAKTILNSLKIGEVTTEDRINQQETNEAIVLNNELSSPRRSFISFVSCGILK